MSGHPFEGRKLFTVEQANAALPLVRAIATDLANLSREVLERRDRIAFLRNGRERDPKNPYIDELAQSEEELQKDGVRLQEFAKELDDLGVDLKNGLEGLLDFPAMHDGRYVYLCWKLGEPEVLHWHELEAGFAGRQPLTAGAVGDSSAFNS